MLARPVLHLLNASRRILTFPTRCVHLGKNEESDASVSAGYFPSPQFIQKYARVNKQRVKLSTLISELQIFIEFHGPNSLPPFTDSTWETLFCFRDVEERCKFLQNLQQNQLNSSAETSELVGDGKRLISEENEDRWRNGEMVYAPSFNCPYELKGQEFRKQLDRSYGSRLWSDLRTEEPRLPRLVVDARFLSEFGQGTQSRFIGSVADLHDSNWSSRSPFSLSIANFRPDTQLSEYAKRQWMFLYGPPETSPNATSFVRHPFAPTVSSRTVRHALQDLADDEIIYISQRSKTFLPERPPSNIKAAVLCLSSDMHPHTSSLTAAVAERLTTYRMPLEKHFSFVVNTPRVPSVAVSSCILRDWFMGEEWATAIKCNLKIRERKLSEKEKAMEAKETYEAFRSAVHEMAREAQSRASRVETGRRKEEEWRERREERREDERGEGKEREHRGRLDNRQQDKRQQTGRQWRKQ